MNPERTINTSAGSKADNLDWLEKEVGHVPPFLVIHPARVIRDYEQLQSIISRLLKDAEADEQALVQKRAEITAAIGSALLDETEIDLIAKQLRQLGAGEYIFRTSAALEDSSSLSFAGIYSSFGPISLKEAELEKFVRGCWSSLFSERAIAYLRNYKIPLRCQEFSVIAQEYYRGEFSGVVFVNPVNEMATIAFTRGGAEEVVGGGTAMTCNINLSSETDAPLQMKMHVRPETWRSFIATLKLIVRRKGRPQDIEWSLKHDGFAIFQTRDVTVPLLTQPQETIWDSTNIAESYPGVTLPLTYSVIRHAYSQVYVNFFASVGVPKTRLSKHEALFSNLLGYLKGRVYYNVTNWYGMLRLLPAYEYNKEFFEAMLNPKKKLEGTRSAKQSLASRLLLLPLLFRFIWRMLRAESLIRRFLARFDEKYSEFKERNLAAMSPFELALYYRSIEKELFTAWQTPILNDFRVMIFHGLFKKMVRAVLERDDDSLLSSLLTNHLELSSLRPIQRLQEICASIKGNEQAARLFLKDQSATALLEALSKHQNGDCVAIQAQIQDYIETFGDRNPSELKLESVTMREHPEILLQLLKSYLKVETETISQTEGERQAKFRKILDGLHDAVRRKHGLLSPFIWAVMQVMLRVAKTAIAMREHLRFKRSMAFGLARRVFLQFGHQLVREGRLKAVTDIFYLTREEVLGLAEGHSFYMSLAPLIEERKRMFTEYKSMASPARRIKTHGFPAFATLVPDGDNQSVSSQTTFAGIPASGGVVRGRVLCLKEFDISCDFKDKILVTLQTDPGWTTVLPLISGLITERGNILSHAAIVSREMGIPSVLAIEGITDVLKTGDIVEIDGSRGTVTVH
jgi:rifampicin phosphotransferase